MFRAKHKIIILIKPDILHYITFNFYTFYRVPVYSITDWLLTNHRCVNAAGVALLQGSRPPIFDLQGSSCVDDPPQYFDKCFSLQRNF